MKWLYKIKCTVDSFLAWVYSEAGVILLRLYIGVVRVTSLVKLREDFIALKKASACPVLLFWHENAFMLLLFRRFLINGGIKVIIAATDRSSYWTKYVSTFGALPVSSGSFLWLRKLQHRRSYYLLAFDGPAGPARKENAEVRYALKRLKVDVCFVNCKAERYLSVGSSWDKRILPLPFNRIEFSLEMITDWHLMRLEQKDRFISQ